VDHATAFIQRQFAELVDEAREPDALHRDFKSALQERVQSDGGPLPEYVVVGESGPDHYKQFHVEVRVSGERVADATGRSKKEAEQEAARRALERIGR
jgi:ribonuclease-3